MCKLPTIYGFHELFLKHYHTIFDFNMRLMMGLTSAAGTSYFSGHLNLTGFVWICSYILYQVRNMTVAIHLFDVIELLILPFD